MRVALFSDTFMPQINGVTNTISKMLKYFSENNIEYKIFAPQYDDFSDKDSTTERFYSLKFFLYPECRIALPNAFRIEDTLNDFKPDLIHVMTEFSIGRAGLKYGKKYNIPVISTYTTHFNQYADYYNLEILKDLVNEYMKWFHNQADKTLCASNALRNDLKDIGILNTDIFSRGIDSNKFNPKLRNVKLRRKLKVDGKIVFLYVGRISLEKDLDILRESYSKVKEIYKDKVSLIITGDGPYLDKCKEEFPKDTIYTGFKKDKELAEIYASSDIFVFPSSTETFGNVILEAMASGLGVIGADAGGVKEIIQHRQNGLKFEKRNAKDLTNCMIELVENRILKEYLTTNALEYAKNRTWDMIINQLINVYFSILNKENKIIA